MQEIQRDLEQAYLQKEHVVETENIQSGEEDEGDKALMTSMNTSTTPDLNESSMSRDASLSLSLSQDDVIGIEIEGPNPPTPPPFTSTMAHASANSIVPLTKEVQEAVDRYHNQTDVLEISADTASTEPSSDSSDSIIIDTVENEVSRILQRSNRLGVKVEKDTKDIHFMGIGRKFVDAETERVSNIMFSKWRDI